jgi:predicted Zn-dependent peptidase
MSRIVRPRVRLAVALAIAVFAAAPPAARAATAKPSTRVPRTGLEEIEKQVQSFTLPNGLAFLVVERHDAPVFSFQTIVNAGAADDEVGTTGLAHMMEHMAFKGTELVGTKDYAAEKSLLEAEDHAWEALIAERRKGARADAARLQALERAFAEAQERARALVESNEFTRLLEQAGAQGLNASTGVDHTNYYYSLPSNRLELWGLLEGSRMAFPTFREFYKEREVVIEERRMRYESSPIGRLYLEAIQSMYQAHPYGFGGIGHTSDLQTFDREEGEAFYRRHYVAKNMCVAVVGDVRLADVKRVAETYFADLSAAPPPPPLDTVEPEQKAERRILMEDAAQPFVIVGWHIPAATDPSFPAYQALASLLAGGDFARLNKVLVKERKVAVQVEAFAGLPGLKYPTMLGLFLVPAAGQDAEAVEREAHELIEEILASKPFTAEELEGWKVRSRAQAIGQAGNNQSLAGALVQAQILHGDWRDFFRQQERIQRLAVDDVMAAMKRSVHRMNRTTALIVPPRTVPADAARAEGGR